MVEPPPRGTLQGNALSPDLIPVDLSAPRDSLMHFPAGARSEEAGSGLRSQEVAGNFMWTPFLPLSKGFNWRAGVCGDTKKGKQEHRRGGVYYHEGKPVRTYVAGSAVGFMVDTAVHHNGFIEFYLCDVEKCGGEISETCYKDGACRQLKRARNKICDEGMSKECGPIDPAYPGRWYLPCANRSPGERVDSYGRRRTMLYTIPDDMTCKHCVLNWYYSTANYCNPPGVVSYFEGDHGPKNWGKCKGQAGAIGGYTTKTKPCGERFPEEYYQCADVRVVAPDSPKKNPIVALEIGSLGDGEFNVIRDIAGGTHTFSIGKYKGITIRAKVGWVVPNARFYLEDQGRRRLFVTRSVEPFFMFEIFGRKNPRKWTTPIMNRKFRVIVTVGDFSVGAWLTLKD